MRRFLIYLNVNFLIGFIILILINVKIDSANIFKENRFYAEAVEILAQGRSFKFNGNWDERKLKKTLLIQNQTPKKSLYILGSSRSMQISKTLLSSNLVNLGVSGGVLQDFIGLYTNIVAVNKNKNDFLLVIDPWMLNQNNGETRWQTLYNDIENFSIDNPEFHNYISADFKINKSILKYTNLFSISYLQTNIKYLFANSKNKLIATDSLYSKNRTVYSNDGAIRYSLDYEDRSKNNLKDKLQSFTRKGRIYHMNDFNVLDTMIVLKLLRHLTTNENSTTILLSPFNHLVYQNLVTKVPQIIEAELFLRRTSKNLGITVLGSYNPNYFTELKSSDFTDAMHLKNMGMKKIIRETGLDTLYRQSPLP